MNHIELLLMVRRFRWYFLALFVTTTIVGGILIKSDVLKYKGESTFYLANESLVDPKLFGEKGQADPLQVSVVQERVYQLAYSTEMIKHLIQQFNLYNHYGIDSTKNYAYEEAAITLTESIRFNKLTPDLSSIVVFDRNNEMAASMSNALVWKLDDLNKKYFNDKIQGNLNFYESFLDESVRISKQQNDSLTYYMNALRDGGKTSGVKTLSEVEFSIYEAVSNIEDVTSQLIMARNLYKNALSLRKSQNLPSLVMVKKAIPDLDSKTPLLFLFSVLLGILGCIVAILILYFYYSYTKELQILFGRKLPDIK